MMHDIRITAHLVNTTAVAVTSTGSCEPCTNLQQARRWTRCFAQCVTKSHSCMRRNECC